MTLTTIPASAAPSAASPWRAEIGATVGLALPLVGTQLAQIAIMTTDVLFMGWLGPEALAAGALGSNVYFLLWVFAIGLGLAVAPLAAQAVGRKQRYLRDVRRSVRQGLWATFSVALPGTFVMWHAAPILRTFGQDPAIAAMAQDYTRALAPGLVAATWFIVLRTFVAAFERPRSGLIVQVLTFALNAALAYALIFGHFGAPALGLVGAGIASAIAHWASVVMLLGFILVDRRFRRFHLLGRFWRPDWRRYREIWRLGLPVSATMLFEVGLFSGAVYAMGIIGTAELAAHQIALQCAAITFMVPLGVGQAATVRVGLFVGAGDAQGVRRAGDVALATGVGFMTVTMIGIWILRYPLAALFLDLEQHGTHEVLELAAAFLIVAGIWQVMDGAQVVAIGALRGLKDTKVPMIIAGFGYWAVGAPAGLIAAFPFGLGGLGIWYGLALGLLVVSVLVVRRWMRREQLGLVAPPA
jgi:multidrug resistance protein, MATE family